jgi:hypothetical protein
LSLIRGVACGAFANIDQLGVAAAVIENRTDVWLNSVLTEHHIAAGNLLDDGATPPPKQDSNKVVLLL